MHNIGLWFASFCLLFNLHLKIVNPVICRLLNWKYSSKICVLTYSIQKIKAEDARNRHSSYCINLSEEVCFALWMFVSVSLCISPVELESCLLCNIIDDRLLIRRENNWILPCSSGFLFFPWAFIGVLFTAYFYLLVIWLFKFPSDTGNTMKYIDYTMIHIICYIRVFNPYFFWQGTDILSWISYNSEVT